MSFHVEKITDDNWRYVVELPRSADGTRNRKKKSGFKNKSEAKKAAKALENQYIRGEFDNKNADMLYSDYLDFWITQIEGVNVFKTSTIQNYKKQIKNHLNPKLGLYSLKALNHIILQDFLNQLAKNGYRKNTIENIKSTLSKSLKYAFNTVHFIDSDPTQSLIIPVSNPKIKLNSQQENVFIPKENINKLLDRFPEGNPDHIPILFGYKCGLRDGEAYAVRWSDINFEEATLNINKQLQFNLDTKEWCLVPPKYNSVRVIGLDKDFVRVLKNELNHQKELKTKFKNYTNPLIDRFGIINYENGEKADFVIRKPDGAFLSSNARQHIARVAHYELEIPYTYHSLRHTHATMLAESGFDPLYTKERLGHKNYNVTMKYYVHPTSKTRLDGQEQLENLLAAL